jgi:integrase
MHLFKQKKSKYWWFKFTHNGRLYRESTKLANKQKARDYASAYRTKLIEGEIGLKRKEPAPTFDAAMDKFLEESKIQHAAHPNTTRRYETASKPLKRFFRKTPIDQITADDVKEYRRRRLREKGERTKRELRPATINRELACLRALFNSYIEDGTITVNPVSKRRGKRGVFMEEDNLQTFSLSHEGEEKYLAECSQPHKDLAIIMLETGMRPSEVARITKANVHLKQNYVFNPHGKTKAAKRKIPLTARAADVLRRRMEQAKGDYLFPHEKDANKPLVKTNHAHEGAVSRAELEKFRIYDLRHTFATRAVESGMDLVTLAGVLGHSKLEMVMRYAHPTEKHWAAAMKRLEEHTSTQKIEQKTTETNAYIN